jgi:hypothetical protein
MGSDGAENTEHYDHSLGVHACDPADDTVCTNVGSSHECRCAEGYMPGADSQCIGMCALHLVVFGVALLACPWANVFVQSVATRRTF